MQWKEHYHRMFLNYGVFLGNSLIAVKYNVGNFFPEIGQILPFYTLHHPIYQHIKFFDLINFFNSPQEVKALFRKNMTVKSSLLERNHEVGKIMLESDK